MVSQWRHNGGIEMNKKPVSRDWLYQKYVTEGLDCTVIGKLVGRDPKSVWCWLRDYGIETRKRGTTGNGFKVGQVSPFAGHTHTPEVREAVRQKRLADGRVPYLRNGQHHLKGKRGAETPNWKGGVTPERQAVYGSTEWKKAVKAVWKRDNATCQRCGKHHNTAANRGTFDIHHIVGFEVAELRCEPSNLVLLCETCHYWVHSNDNTERVFLP